MNPLQNQIKQAAKEYADKDGHGCTEQVRGFKANDFNEGASFVLPLIEQRACAFLVWTNKHYRQSHLTDDVYYERGKSINRRLSMKELYQAFTEDNPIKL